MGRPTKAEKRDRQLNLKLTVREFDWVRARAGREGMKPVDFGRAQLLAERPVRVRQAAPGHLDPLFFNQLSRIGNNLNQLTRRLHLFQIPAPSELGPLLQSIREIIRKASSDGA